MSMAVPSSALSPLSSSFYVDEEMSSCATAMATVVERIAKARGASSSGGGGGGSADAVAVDNDDVTHVLDKFCYWICDGKVSFLLSCLPPPTLPPPP